MPSEKLKKKLFIKRIYKINDHHLKLLCTDGFLIDNALNVPTSHQAYSKERIEITQAEQLPSQLKLSNELLHTMNDKLPLFEIDARINMTTEKIIAPKETIRQIQPEKITREFHADKAFDVLTEISHEKKEMKVLAENTTKTMQEEISKTKVITKSM